MNNVQVLHIAPTVAKSATIPGSDGVPYGEEYHSRV